jgi:ABC-type nitrate/sulfonate/bicarbonate transport system substrate-binding protein
MVEVIMAHFLEALNLKVKRLIQSSWAGVEPALNSGGVDVISASSSLAIHSMNPVGG